MLVVAFLHWWYGPGWRDAGRRLGDRMWGTYLNLSVPILLRTMFAPWRRIITESDGAIGQRVRALIDNTVSRCVGFSVRLIVLLTALVLLAGYAVIGGALLLLWPLLPVLGVALIVGGFVP